MRLLAYKILRIYPLVNTLVEKSKTNGCWSTRLFRYSGLMQALRPDAVQLSYPSRFLRRRIYASQKLMKGWSSASNCE